MKKIFAVSVFIVMFFFGYGLTGERLVKICSAAPVPTVSGGVCGCGAGTVPCDAAGTAATLVFSLEQSLIDDFDGATEDLGAFLASEMDTTVDRQLQQLGMLEQYMISWWKTMWSYNLLPSWQTMTDQWNTDLAQQAFSYLSNADATGQLEVKLALEKRALKDRKSIGTGDNVCVMATTSGGQGRASNFGRAMRLAWEKESLINGLNTKDTYASAGILGSEAKRHEEYNRLFCDPDGNGGFNDCRGSDPAFYNADVQPTKRLYETLTVDVTDPKKAQMVETLINNMVGGPPTTDPFVKLSGTASQGKFLNRRSYLARYAALRTVPQIVAGWRMPGSRLKDWVGDIRKAAGLPDTAVSENPSYKEILHAISVDRFNSGKYAMGMITDEGKIAIEKLNLSAFYLMQLRDYYELLERTALTLAVQVSVQSDAALSPPTTSSAPVRNK